ncbi:hypothetical protein [Thomasclavelia ramosa]|uniref:hypothetical protein n=1 Tax=Thomasclavelia ramosa TaxID=1547 RepID=UPI0018F2099D|nr:hypothetical protein [Thomasclavelia ramosa]
MKKYNFKAELGIPFDTKPEPYLNTEKLGADVKKAISENTKVTVDVSKACKGK